MGVGQRKTQMRLVFPWEDHRDAPEDSLWGRNLTFIFYDLCVISLLKLTHTLKYIF